MKGEGHTYPLSLMLGRKRIQYWKFLTYRDSFFPFLNGWKESGLCSVFVSQKPFVILLKSIIFFYDLAVKQEISSFSIAKSAIFVSPSLHM